MYMIFFTSFKCIWFYLAYLQIMPFFIILAKPFHSIDLQTYMTYIVTKILRIKQRVSADAPFIEQGYILANHRSWTDFVFEPMMSQSTVVARKEAFWAVWFSYCLGYLDNRVISFTRGAETRQDLFSRIKMHMGITKYKRILFFPEGTRLKYTQLNSPDDVKQYLKYGILKCIYEDKQFPVQLQISNNKELVLDEKRLHIQYGVHINTHLSKPIHPKDYATEQLFYDEIAYVWYECWKITHLSQDAHQ